MIYIGCSGWQYRDWRKSFYPTGVAQKRWLEHYAERFATVEINNTFYMLPKPETFAAWRERVPADFVVGVKMSRYLTHIKRLREPEEPIERFISHAEKLGPRLGPVLLQLPPNLKRVDEDLDLTLGLLAKHRVRVAVEFRHDSWFSDEVAALLTSHGAALSWADRMSRVVSPLWRTTDWGYLRLHEGRGTPHPCYGKQALLGWAERVAEAYPAGEDVFVYFNNDPNACAVRDAVVFARACATIGLETTRVPDPSEVQVWGDPVGAWPAWFSRSVER